MNRPALSRSQRGFTLIEAMVTLTISAILVAVAVPSFTSVVRKFKLNSISSALATSLLLARSEAVKSNRRVLVCARNAVGSACAASTDWGRNGWLVCYDLDADGACDAASPGLPNPIRLADRVDPEFASVSGPATALSFNSLGSQGPMSATTLTITVQGSWTGAAPVTTSIAGSGLVKSAKL